MHHLGGGSFYNDFLNGCFKIGLGSLNLFCDVHVSFDDTVAAYISMTRTKHRNSILLMQTFFFNDLETFCDGVVSFDDMVAAYISMTRTRHRNNILLMQPFSSQLFGMGSVPGPTILMKLLRGEISADDVETEFEHMEEERRSSGVQREAMRQLFECHACTLKGNGDDAFKPVEDYGCRTSSELMVKVLSKGCWRRCTDCSNKAKGLFGIAGGAAGGAAARADSAVGCAACVAAGGADSAVEGADSAVEGADSAVEGADSAVEIVCSPDSAVFAVLVVQFVCSRLYERCEGRSSRAGGSRAVEQVAREILAKLVPRPSLDVDVDLCSGRSFSNRDRRCRALRRQGLGFRSGFAFCGNRSGGV